MVHVGCVIVAGIHPSRTKISESFMSVRWNAYVHRLDLGLYSHSCREGIHQAGVIPPAFFFFIFIDAICDQLSTHIPQAMHTPDLALWTKAEHVTTAAIRLQEAMNLISEWAK